VVVQELVAGAWDAHGRRQAEHLYRPFERVGRVVTPTHGVWKQAGLLWATIAKRRPAARSKLRAGLLNDMLIALSARSIGAMVVTRNRDDFRLIQTFAPFRLAVV
jgi:predicted nucleic acid-binding protein